LALSKRDIRAERHHPYRFVALASTRRDAVAEQQRLTISAVVYIVDFMADLLGTFEQAVLLAVWNLAAQAYGRAILRGTQITLDREAAAGAVYATLDRLEQKGLLTSRVEAGTPVRSGRARRYYRLTAVGVRALNESKTALEQMWRSTKWPLESKA
jgi:PadR family transcriptional regulator, regulatory protein PadR